MNTISIRARSIGEILDGAFRLYRQDLGLYVLTAVLAGLPMAISMVLTLGGTDPDAFGWLGFVSFFVAAVAYIVAWSALMHQMNERLEGRQPAFAPSMSRAFRLFLRVLWAGIITYIVLVLAMFAVFAGAAVVGVISGLLLGAVVTGILAVVAGLALTLTLGVRAFAGCMLFMPGIIAEGLTGFASVKRGLALAKGGQFRVTSVLFLAWILIFVPVTAVYFVTGTTRMIWDPAATTNGTIGMGQLAVQQLLAMVSSGFTTPFLVACILLLYYDQRVRLEAFDLEAEAGALAD